MKKNWTLLSLFRRRPATDAPSPEHSAFAKKLTESVKALQQNRDDLRAETGKLRRAILYAAEEIHILRKDVKELTRKNEDLELFCGRAMHILSQPDGNEEATNLLNEMWAYKSEWLVKR